MALAMFRECGGMDITETKEEIREFGLIVEVLHFIAKKQDIELPDQLASNIAEKSKRCLQQAIRSFEATWHSKYARLSPQLPAFILNQLIINTTQVNK
ncbi:hypothetical protein NC651_008541 [Populus alba x Populus x berolinensis]|nr:hypothetical protein NC651_008541 [Populus alba x Populus x berolinensis]